MTSSSSTTSPPTTSSSHDARLTTIAGVARSAGFRRILVSFDGSSRVEEALRTAGDLADELCGEVEVLLVVRASAPVETPEELVLSAVAERDRLSHDLAGAEVVLGRRFGQRVVFSSDPARAIAHYAEEHGFDLIVVCPAGGDPDHRGLDDQLSVLLGRRPCPVLVV